MSPGGHQTSTAGGRPAVAEDSARAQVERWLRTSGLVLEVRVARALAQGGMKIREGVRYTDQAEGKEREIDVVAEKAWPQTSHKVQLVVECKSSSCGPWVVVSPTVPEPRPSLGIPQSGPVFEDQLPPASLGVQLSACLPGLRVGNRIGTARDGKNVAWDACRQVLSETTGLQKQQQPAVFVLRNSGPARPQPEVWTLPVVVTAAPLFFAEPGPEQTVVEKVDHAALSVPHGKAAVLVHLVTEQGLTELTGRLSPAGS